MMGLSTWHLIILLAIVVLVFGAGRISGVMGDVAKGIKSFKKGLADDDESPPETAKSISHGGDRTVAGSEPLRNEKS
ncbi:MAG: twin-arginine translocase TatA/TatE family subunit [Hyphomicrobiaceae bacterium]